MKKYQILKYLSFIFVISFLQGCFSSKNHINRAQLVKSGQSETDWAYSTGSAYDCTQNKRVDPSDKKLKCFNADGSPNSNYVKSDFGAYSYHYRLGIANEFWKFKGLDFGYSMEVPNTVEFDLRIGLPSFRNDIDHTFSLGWSWGLFNDNTYFGEYAISKRIKELTLYSSIRLSHVATHFRNINSEANDGEADEFLDISNKFWLGELAVGTSYKLPEIDLIADRINASIHSRYDKVNLGNVNFHDNDSRGNHFYFLFGIGWDFL
jgi:hypothetical protein